DVVGFSLNYLSNVPEVVDLARAAKAARPGCGVVVGGHSASFVAADLLAGGERAIDCVVRGEGEGVMPRVIEALAGGPALETLPGVVTAGGTGPGPPPGPDPGAPLPARQLPGGRR